MTLGIFALIVFLFAVIGALPLWPHSRNWGYWPTGLAVIAVCTVAVLMLAEGGL